MTISQKRLIVVQLDEYLTILDKSLVALEYSYHKQRQSILSKTFLWHLKVT